MVEYAFSRGPVRSEETWSVDEAGITTDQGRTIAWSQITEAAFSDMPGNRRIQVAELTLVAGEERIKVNCNAGRKSPSRVAFLRMCHDVARQLNRARPDIRFVPAKGFSIATWAFAAIGLGMVIFGLYYVVLGLSDWGGRGSGFALGMGIGAALLGLFVAWSASPWKKIPPKTPAEAAEWIERVMALG